jgi:hypothetical protein
MLAPSRKHRVSLRFIFAFAFLAGSVFAQQSQPPDTISGITEPSVYPLLDEAGMPIQWNASTFEGFVFPGSYNGPKKGICVHAPYCYGYDGRGDWQFNLTGAHFCQNTCTYTATGDLVISLPITLPDGSFIMQLSAVLTGTFVDQSGTIHPNVMGYYSTYTAPTRPGFHGIPVPAAGGITVVLEDN